MLTRRHFLSASSAAGTLALAGPALAGPPPDWSFPDDWQPKILRIRNEIAEGEIWVDPNNFHLYLGLPDRKVIRYTVGVGRGDLYESGQFTIGAKKEWPTWRPTDEMIERNPAAYARWAEGMPGGPTNPLGARALYLFRETGGDSFLRIHGTPEPWTLSSAVSNGCVRLANSHIEHLYPQVPIGARVVLLPKTPAA